MFATIYLPNFYLQAVLRHQSELCAKPVALLNEEDAKPVILQLNQAAECAGVCKGMTPSQGLARCLHLIVKVRSQTQEKLLDEILLQHAFMLAPLRSMSSNLRRTGGCEPSTQTRGVISVSPSGGRNSRRCSDVMASRFAAGINS